MSELPPLESSAKTAIGAGSSGKGGTVGSYITADKLFSQQGGTKLDYGSGRGEGAKLIKADTYEPYVKSKPNYSASSQIPSNSYDKVTSLNVLNVIPPKERKEAVKEIARVLKPNGEAIISTRGKDVEAAKTKVKVKDGYVIGKGDQARFQKGFGVEELKKYVQKILGKGFTVQPVKLGKAAVKITKGGAGKSPLEDKQFGFPKPELFDVADPAMKTNFNEGGTVMEKQESGLADDGGTIEEESGNEVPVGSLENEVKDDIDAKLSEGEFVFPADVVRFIGLNKLMAMRQKAKQGLQKMEDMGQMGNADEATVPDTMEWDENEMIKADTENEFNKGGIALAPGGVTTTRSDQGSRFQGLQPTPTTTTSPEEEDDEIDEILDVEEDTDFEDVAEDAEEGILTYEQLMGGVENFYEIRSFYNPDTKRIHRVAFINGEATSPVPDSWIDTKSEEYDTLIKEQQQNTEKEVVQEINGVAPESDKDENEAQRENEERKEYTKQVLGLSEISSEGNSITDIFNKGSDASGDSMLKRISRAVLMNALGVPLWAAIIGEKLGVTKKLAGAINASLAGDESEETQEIIKKGKTDVIETAKKHSPIYMDSPDYIEDRFKKPLGAGGVIAPTVQDYFDGKKDVYEYLNSKDQLTVMFGSSSAPEFMLRDFDDDYKGEALLTITGEIGYNAGDMDPTTGGIFNNAGQAIDIRTNKLLNSYNNYDNFMLGKKLGIETGWWGGEISYDTWVRLGPDGKIKYEKYYQALQREGIAIAQYGRNETPFQHQVNKVLESGNEDDINRLVESSIVTDSEGNAVRSSQDGTPVTSLEGSFLTNAQKNQLADINTKNILNKFVDDYDYQYDTSIEQFETAINNGRVTNKTDLIEMIQKDQSQKAQEFTPFEPSADIQPPPLPTLIQTDTNLNEGQDTVTSETFSRVEEKPKVETENNNNNNDNNNRSDATVVDSSFTPKVTEEEKEWNENPSNFGGSDSFKKGGLATKAKKKSMKRGGLASKK